MTLQYSTALRNAALDALETALGASPILKILSGPPPADCAAIETGTVLATLNLPADFMAPASGGSKTMAGAWQDASADASGHASYFRMYDSAGVNCGMQGYAVGPWKPSFNFAVGDHVTNDGGKVYRCTTGGLSAASGGPTGTGSAIADGGAVWSYIQAAAEMNLTNLDFTAGQSFSVSQFTITAGNA